MGRAKLKVAVAFLTGGHLSSSIGYMKGKIGGLNSFLILETIGYNLWGDY